MPFKPELQKNPIIIGQTKLLRYKQFQARAQKDLDTREQKQFQDSMRATLLKISRQRRRETRQLLLQLENEMSQISAENINYNKVSNGEDINNESDLDHEDTKPTVTSNLSQ